jgi:hypothetical protein
MPCTIRQDNIEDHQKKTSHQAMLEPKLLWKVSFNKFVLRGGLLFLSGLIVSVDIDMDFMAKQETTRGLI